MSPSKRWLVPSLFRLGWLLVIVLSGSNARPDVGDPQIRTAHPWYPGELACSTFERLFLTEAEQYERLTGAKPLSDQGRALAAWFWRNTHYWHGEEGAEDLWGSGFSKGDLRTREYWTGLFAQGFGLCGTTHSQWTAEMEQLFGHARSRGVGVQGHNSFEAWLTGGKYGTGRWALLDHDISTVIFNQEGDRLLSIAEVQPDVKRWIDRTFAPQKQHGWLVCGLHPEDGGAYNHYTTAEYLAGYAGPPPMVHLRRGETLRRYLQPGLEDGKTFVYWGRNYRTGGIPGPERSLTWVNQPEKMNGSAAGAGYKPGQARFANAVYIYKPDFKGSDYREGVIEEGEHVVVFEFYSPYIIAATPANDKPWGIYDAGCRNGLQINGKAACSVSISVDQGGTWKDCGSLREGMDLTDEAKGHRQFFLRFGASAAELIDSGLSIRTVCQAAVGVLPRLQDGQNTITFAASKQGLVAAGPNKVQAARHIIAGAFDSPSVTLQLATPRQEPISSIYASAQIASGNPPLLRARYQIEYSLDQGRTWNSMVKDWAYLTRGQDPGDFWSQSLCYGSVAITSTVAFTVQIRFHNDSAKKYLRAEASLVYRTASNDATEVVFDWSDQSGHHADSHLFSASEAAPWKMKIGQDAHTHWVEFGVIPR